jgi:hypothetical protein
MHCCVYIAHALLLRGTKLRMLFDAGLDFG